MAKKLIWLPMKVILHYRSIIDTLPISPENILVVDDYDSVFYDDVVETHDKNGWLTTSEKNCKITNSIWDGQSLMDISLFGDYSQYGMVLLRNLMFKSCCFNCNIHNGLRITTLQIFHNLMVEQEQRELKM